MYTTELAFHLRGAHSDRASGPSLLLFGSPRGRRSASRCASFHFRTYISGPSFRRVYTFSTYSSCSYSAFEIRHFPAQSTFPPQVLEITNSNLFLRPVSPKPSQTNSNPASQRTPQIVTQRPPSALLLFGEKSTSARHLDFPGLTKISRLLADFLRITNHAFLPRASSRFAFVRTHPTCRRPISFGSPPLSGCVQIHAA
jgi:hypothetical protein